MTTERYSLGIDIGGTFTDIVLYNHADGRVFSHKELTTPEEPTVGAIRGVTTLLEREQVRGAQVARIVHATTLFTNALIERRGVQTGLITTEGFRDTLEMRREFKFDLYDLFIEMPATLVPREARMEALQMELNAANDLAERRATELSRVRGLLDEARLLASARQVEIEARESEITGLTLDLDTARDAIAAETARLAQSQAASGSMSETLQAERRRVTEIAAKSERLYAELADREAALHKREGDLAQLREALAGATRANSDLDARLGKVLAEKSRLEARLAESEQRRERPPLSPEEEEAAVARLVAERRRLEERLAIVTRQNQKLRADLAARDSEPRQETSGQDRAANAVLREQIAQIAAEMAHMVERLEGKDSPILRIVPPGPPVQSGEAEPSLADRIQALRSAASS